MSLTGPRAINSVNRLARLDAILYTSAQTMTAGLTIQPYAAIKIGPVPDLLSGRVVEVVMMNAQTDEAKP